MNKITQLQEQIVALKAENQQLRQQKDYYETIFQYSPVALLEEDCSAIKAFIDDLKAQGITDFNHYFQAHRDDVIKCLNTLDNQFLVNQEYLDVFKAHSQKQLIDEMYDSIQTEHSYQAYIQLFVAFAEGQTRFTCGAIDNDLEGNAFHSVATWVIAPDCLETWTSVLVCLIPSETIPEVV